MKQSDESVITQAAIPYHMFNVIRHFLYTICEENTFKSILNIDYRSNDLLQFLLAWHI